MKKEIILEKLNGIFRENFDDDTIVVSEKTTASDIDEWDSLEHVNLMAKIEKEFNVKFELREMLTLKDVGEMVNLLEKKIGA
ncbi:acyl carrier protein [Fibrobacter succinogenes]|uniref:Acyl carrier protein n=1 Tax=Fibrobacter succinogenes TaxID=833 RepID=A0A380S5D9_FIBSU|nr:acyl carrier protein [Fibrobacter succinogenes]PWJ35384.1 acyl carrier protein [Fibrobacter succinogenes subsp. elongatus]SUQ24040.1 acyl carrier protein [Fibrobacter succinogenes]